MESRIQIDCLGHGVSYRGQVPRVTNINFLLKTLIDHFEKKSWEIFKWSAKKKCFVIRFSQLIIEEMFGDQPEEFVCWYNWGLKGFILWLLQPIMYLRKKNLYKPFLWGTETGITSLLNLPSLKSEIKQLITMIKIFGSIRKPTKKLQIYYSYILHLVKSTIRKPPWKTWVS